MSDETEAATIDIEMFYEASAKAEQSGLESLTDPELLTLVNAYGYLHNQSLALLRQRAAERGEPTPTSGRLH